MGRLGAVALAIFFALGITLAASPGRAYAQNACDQEVVDNSDPRLPSPPPEFRKHLKHLRDLDAVVRIRIEQRAPDVAGYLPRQIASCASWREDGKAHDRLVAIIVSLVPDDSRPAIKIYAGSTARDYGLNAQRIAAVEDAALLELAHYTPNQPDTWPAVYAGIAIGAEQLAKTIQENANGIGVAMAVSIITSSGLVSIVGGGLYIISRRRDD